MDIPQYRLNIEEIREFLPHRYPFLLVDRVLSIEPKGDIHDLSVGPSKEGTRVVAQKCVTFNEPFFQGHFPEMSLMPGVILTEMMAQTTCFSLYPQFTAQKKKLTGEFQCVLVGVDGARFRKPVVPGDVCTIESVVTKIRGGLWNFDCVIRVEGNEVASASIMAKLVLKKDVL
jgi:3-hydroxyacyl-[acyl-carrier-protein] dehydratase